MGIQESKELVVDVAKVVNVLSELVHGKLLALVNAVPLFFKLKNINFDLVKKELADLDSVEREDILSTFIMAIDLVDKDVQNKLISTVDTLSMCLDMVKDVVVVVNDVKLVVEKVKKIYSI